MSEGAITREAWWGGDRSHGATPMPVHVVDWPEIRDHGYTLCGKHIQHVVTYPLGTAASVRTATCTPCQRRLAARAPSAPVVPIQSHRRKALR